MNLVKNALEAMPDGGALTVITRITRNGVALDLIDTGTGMDEQTALHMFDAFYSTKDGGSGLGLPTARKIIEAHGGRSVCRATWDAAPSSRSSSSRRGGSEPWAGVHRPSPPAPAATVPREPRSCIIEGMSESSAASADDDSRADCRQRSGAGPSDGREPGAGRLSLPVATSGPEGVRHIEQDTYDVIITDLVMNEVDGMEVLARAKQCLPDAEVIMVTGHASVPKAVEAMQQGAFNFLEKPITPNRLRAVTERAADAVRLRRDNVELNKRLDERFGFEGIIYTSDSMKQVIDRVKRIAPTDATVLITGDSGTGKELIAQAIHQNSPRKGKRLFPLNCAAVAENLVESELFGHVKGAYTDARTDRVGAFEYANGGTLFLDEVGDMPRATQTKLLRVLEENRITRVGDNKPIEVNVRVLSATNRSLEDAIASGDFREDLYYRLKVVTRGVCRRWRTVARTSCR